MYDYDKHISWYVYYTWILHENAHDKSMLTWTQKCLRYTEYFYGCIVLMQVLWLLSINERLVSLFCVCQYALYVRVTRDMLATEERNDMQVVHDEIWLLISWSGKWTNFWIYMKLYILLLHYHYVSWPFLRFLLWFLTCVRLLSFIEHIELRHISFVEYLSLLISRTNATVP